MKCISPTTIIVHNILDTVYLGMFKHLMDWVMSFLEQHSRIDKFNKCWVIMPPYPGFARFNMRYSQLTQWSGTEMKALCHNLKKYEGTWELCWKSRDGVEGIVLQKGRDIGRCRGCGKMVAV